MSEEDFVVDKVDDEFDMTLKKDVLSKDVLSKDVSSNEKTETLNTEQLKKIMSKLSRKELMDMKKNLMNGNMNESDLTNMLNVNKIDKTLDKKDKLKQKLKMLKDARKSKN